MKAKYADEKNKNWDEEKEGKNAIKLKQKIELNWKKDKWKGKKTK